ncbi:hypothetical protein QUA74_29000 [Microcoleus sp. LAD1_D3]|uniref:hypothetical protein n=1 Tax=Microcoleus sp. LAD1_D3 TaxID=2819365 RepID=UPI002FD1AEA9
MPIPQKAGTHFEKKTLRSSQAHKEINQKKRLEYWEKIRDVEPENLIFLDEMGVLLGMIRPRARSKGSIPLFN